MTASTLLLGLLWHACLTTTLTHAHTPCDSEVRAAARASYHTLGAFTPSGERRHEPGDFPLPLYYVGEPPARLDPSDIERAIEGAITTWNNVPCSSAAMQYRGHVEKLADVPDDAFVIAHFEESQAPCLRAGEVSRIGAAPCFVGGDRARAAVFNRSQMRWYMLDEVGYVRDWRAPELPWIDFQAALTHELGHLLGLNHPSDHTPRASMFASYRVDGGQSQLAATDRAHLCALYPKGDDRTQTCDTNSSCVDALHDPGARCVELGTWRVCDKERGTLGDYCADNLLICEDLCLITSPPTKTGYCTTRCVEDEECGEGWACDEEGLEDPDPARRGICEPLAGVQASPGCQMTGRHGPDRAPWHVWWMGLVAMYAWRRRRVRRS